MSNDEHLVMLLEKQEQRLMSLEQTFESLVRILSQERALAAEAAARKEKEASLSQQLKTVMGKRGIASVKR